METQAKSITPPEPKPEPPKRLRLIEERVGAAVLGLLKLAPLNPSARALLLASIRVPIPDDADTYEKIKDWYEFTKEISNDPQFPTKVVTPPEFLFSITASQNERGTCSYSRNVSGHETYALSLEEMREIVRDCINMSEFHACLKEKISETVDDNPPSLDDADDLECHDYDCSDPGELDWSYPTATLRTARDFLAMHFPDALRRLESAE